MHDVIPSVLLAGAAVALLRWPKPDGEAGETAAGEQDLALCAGAMVWAAMHLTGGAGGEAAPQRRVIDSLLTFQPAPLARALGGAAFLRPGLARYLQLSSCAFAGYHDALLLDWVAEFLRAARRLSRPRRREAFLCALCAAKTLPDGRARADALARLAHGLANGAFLRRRFESKAQALIWLYGVRAAWMWRAAGGGRSPFIRVPYSRLRAAQDWIQNQ